MARSLVATEIGVKRAKEALIDLGITQTVLAEKRLKYSRSTVSNFFNRKPIAHENFTEICKILKLEWRDIAEITEEKTMESVVFEETCNTNSAERLAFAIAGTVDQVDQAKLAAIIQLLQKITGDASISIVDVKEGSIKLILTGTPEALEMIKVLYKSGELTEVEGIPIVNVDFENLSEAESSRVNLNIANRAINSSLNGLQQQTIPQQQPQIQSSLESRKPQKKRHKPTRKKLVLQMLFRDLSSGNEFSSGNEYSKVLTLGFAIIKFFFFFLAGFVITYVFTWFFDQVLAASLLGFGFQLLSPLIVCVSCIMAIMIIIEACRQ